LNLLEVSQRNRIYSFNLVLVICPQFSGPSSLRQREPEDEDQLGLVVKGNPGTSKTRSQSPTTILTTNEQADENQLDPVAQGNPIAHT